MAAMSKIPQSGHRPWSGQLRFLKKEMKNDGTETVSQETIYFFHDTIMESFKSYFPDADKDTLVRLQYYTSSTFGVKGIHGFLLIQTKAGYWTLDKHSKGITLQYSKDLKAVLNFISVTAREGPIRPCFTSIKFEKSDLTMSHLIKLIWLKDELHRVYRLFLDNCRDFAIRMVKDLCSDKGCYRFYRNVVVAGNGHFGGPLGCLGRVIKYKRELLRYSKSHSIKNKCSRSVDADVLL